MLIIDKCGNIHITRGDSCSIATEFYIDSSADGVRDSDEPIVELTENACVIFTVRSKDSGIVKIKHVLTEDNYENGELVLNLLPEETLLTAAVYEYSFVYVPDSETLGQAYTYAQGDFEIMHSVSTYKDLEG